MGSQTGGHPGHNSSFFFNSYKLPLCKKPYVIGDVRLAQLFRWRKSGEAKPLKFSALREMFGACVCDYYFTQDSPCRILAGARVGSTRRSMLHCIYGYSIGAHDQSNCFADFIHSGNFSPLGKTKNANLKRLAFKF
jgi:hypothetical protein